MDKTIENKLTLEDILYGDEGKYGFLFPYRDRIPKIDRHIFSDFRSAAMTMDKYIVSQILNPDYIGWTAKTILNLDLFPEQIAILQTLWKTPFPMLIASRGGSKSFMLATYPVLRALLDPGSKIVIVGAGLRQARLVFNYVEQIWNNAPVLRSIVGGGKKAGPRQNIDLCYIKIGQSIITALPLGDGTKIRGFRATVTIADEFASIPAEVFDIVVKGFGSTSKTPVEEARRIAMEKKLKQLGLSTKLLEPVETDSLKGNQTVYSGTAYYEFNHFYKRYKLYKDIIYTRGDQEKISDLFGGPLNIPEKFNHKDYAIIRLPHTFLPAGLLDERQLANAKATLPRNIYLMEYGATFVKDSNGFFARSLLEMCTVKPGEPIPTPDGDALFVPMMEGQEGRKYVIGIDPAAERDRLSVIVIEVWANHYRIVHLWTSNKPDFNKKKKIGIVDSDDYYDYCCIKILDIVKKFKPIRIEMDSQGGGYPIAEMLRNKKRINKEKGEFPIYEVIDYKEPKNTDGLTDGPHILHLVKQGSEFNAAANVCLHKSFETRKLLFPAFDTVQMQSALLLEKDENIIVDTYEDCVNNIEELKNELCTIQLTETSTGKEKFDTISINTGTSPDGKIRKGKLRKDRYTSLLLAHKYIYDNDVKIDNGINYNDVPGNFRRIKNVNKDEGLYTGPGIGRFKNGNSWINNINNVRFLKQGKNNN